MYDNKKKILLMLLIITLIFSLFTVYIYSFGSLSVSAKSALLYEPTNDTVLYSKNPHKRMGMASTTKIMSAVCALENSDPEKIVEIDERAVGIEGSSIYLEKGEQFKMLDLIYALMLQSANDAAVAISYEIAGGVDEFAALMNEKACELGLSDTHFTNPHGLDDKEHYTTAYDLAKITAYALENPIFKEIVSTYKYEIQSSLKSRILVNHNKLLNSYDGAIGVKTGFTKKSGRSLVGASERDGIRLISVTINAPDDWRDHKAMLDYGYMRLEQVCLANVGEFSYNLPVLSSESEQLRVENREELSKILPKSRGKTDVKVFLPSYVVAPIKRGDTVGKVCFYINGKEIGSVDLIASFDIEKNSERDLFPFF